MLKEDFYRFLDENRGRVIGGCIGLVLAVILVSFGFWRGLFVIFFILAGTYLGGRVEKSESVRRLVSNLWFYRDRY